MRPLIPLRRRSPWTGRPPGAAVAVVAASRPRSVLVGAALIAVARPGLAAFVRPPRLPVPPAAGGLRQPLTVRRDERRGRGQVHLGVCRRDPNAAGTTFVRDTFTGVAGTFLENHAGEIGTPWTVYAGSANNGTLDAAGRLYATSAVSGGTVYAAAGLPPANNPDYDISADYGVVGAGNSTNALLARFDTSAGSLTAYAVYYDRANALWFLVRYVAGVGTTLATFAETLATNDTRHVVFRLRGPTLSVLIEGLQRLLATDATLTSAFRVGVWMNGTDTSSTGIHLDNYNAVSTVNWRRPGGNLKADGPARPARGSVQIGRVPASALVAAAFRPKPVLVASRGLSPRAGRIILLQGPRPLVVFGADAFRAPDIWRQDRRGFGGLAVRVQPPRPNVFFGPGGNRQAAVRQGRDFRFTPGRVVQAVPPRPLVVFGPDSFRAPDVYRRDERGYRGQAVRVAPSRPLVLFGAPGREATVVRQDRRVQRGGVVTVQPPRLRVVFEATSGRQVDIYRRDERGYRGAALAVRPPRPQVLFAPAAVRVPDVWQKPDARWQAGRIVQTVPPRPFVTFGPDSFRAPDVWQRPDSRWTSRVAGTVVRSLPARVNVAVVQERLQPVTVARRADFRFQAGRVVVTVPPRPAVAFAPAAVRQADLWRQADNRFTRGQVVREGVAPRSTAALPASKRGPVVVSRDQRGFAGQVRFVRGPRPQVVFAPATARAVRIANRDQRGFAGQVLRVQPPRLRVVFGPALGRQATVLRLDRRYLRGAVLVVQPPRTRVVFGPESLRTARVVCRDQRGTAGRLAVIVGPRRTNPGPVVPQTWPIRLVRRDQRGFNGAVSLSRGQLYSIVVIVRGNYRAPLSLRAAPTTALTLRPGPTAELTLRAAPTAPLVFTGDE